LPEEEIAAREAEGDYFPERWRVLRELWFGLKREAIAWCREEAQLLRALATEA
jgi:hypothetical protein